MSKQDSKFGDYDGGHGSSFPEVTEYADTPPAGEIGYGSDLDKTQAEVVTREEFERGAP